MERLNAFWSEITRQDAFAGFDGLEAMRPLLNGWSAMAAMVLGQPGFFEPRFPNPWLVPRGSAGATSFYDTAALKTTLEKLIDFDLLNEGEMRVSIGAVEVETGNLVWFDNQAEEEFRTRIGVHHVMASGALPPALPAVRIGEHHYWDGGIVSNTPLDYLLEQDCDRSTLVFQVDLFPAQGPMPQDMAEVLARQKDITYSSRTRCRDHPFQAGVPPAPGLARGAGADRPGALERRGGAARRRPADARGGRHPPSDLSGPTLRARQQGLRILDPLLRRTPRRRPNRRRSDAGKARVVHPAADRRGGWRPTTSTGRTANEESDGRRAPARQLPSNSASLVSTPAGVSRKTMPAGAQAAP